MLVYRALYACVYNMVIERAVVVTFRLQESKGQKRSKRAVVILATFKHEGLRFGTLIFHTHQAHRLRIRTSFESRSLMRAPNFFRDRICSSI